MAVYFNTKKQKWHARKFVAGRNYHIGFYDSPDEADRAVAEFTRAMKPIAELEPEYELPPAPKHDVKYPTTAKKWYEASKKQIASLSKHPYAVKIDSGGTHALESL